MLLNRRKIIIKSTGTQPANLLTFVTRVLHVASIQLPLHHLIESLWSWKLCKVHMQIPIIRAETLKSCCKACLKCE
jgi:hypothetical protein